MKANDRTAIVGESVVLVPYRREHVARYHEWMADPELRELTASEPLTIEEEYEMQRKWQEDEDKLTFIILAREPAAPNSDAPSVDEIKAMPMIGDVNLFLNGDPADDDEYEAEVEIMIAERAYRRSGRAREALQLMFAYATSRSSPAPLPVPARALTVRIGETNEASVRLFEKMGFAVVKRVSVFEEVEMRLVGDSSVARRWTEGHHIEFP
ncbi:acyl-CoA N-acyltransferase [Punctularia strigosozonata HHB-11173 SS5]|uniref:Acyl-CoA N-acyltransferase n=1 Tax=Punctularia strigosozonata (strain HHB-11173) TaxID=741275 RepID=R7S0U0_PUNST|nr:acyl-CoA N-acyltransferase [Punctularia strigosozonata HHB-11173 SS5]EIN03469.1 acyl-CoA N-acyltransferase [Punctularia strigosozonata HHB-11173 SS5]